MSAASFKTNASPGSSGGSNYSGRGRPASNTEPTDGDQSCMGGCGNAQCDAKRGLPHLKNKIKWWFLKLDPLSDNQDSDRSTPDSLKYESNWSVQDKDTDEPQNSFDESDDNDRYPTSESEDSEGRIVGHQWQGHHEVEYEVHSSSSDLDRRVVNPFVTNPEKKYHTDSSESSRNSDLEAVAVMAALTKKAYCDDYNADESSDVSDPEIHRRDRWACLRCKKKNQPLPRYCQHCFSIRKKWFPPRPKGRKKRTKKQSASLPARALPNRAARSLMNRNLSEASSSNSNNVPTVSSSERKLGSLQAGDSSDSSTSKRDTIGKCPIESSPYYLTEMKKNELAKLRKQDTVFPIVDEDVVDNRVSSCPDSTIIKIDVIDFPVKRVHLKNRSTVSDKEDDMSSSSSSSSRNSSTYEEYAVLKVNSNSQSSFGENGSDAYAKLIQNLPANKVPQSIVDMKFGSKRSRKLSFDEYVVAFPQKRFCTHRGTKVSDSEDSSSSSRMSLSDEEHVNDYPGNSPSTSTENVVDKLAQDSTVDEDVCDHLQNNPKFQQTLSATEQENTENKKIGNSQPKSPLSKINNPDTIEKYQNETSPTFSSQDSGIDVGDLTKRENSQSTVDEDMVVHEDVVDTYSKTSITSLDEDVVDFPKKNIISTSAFGNTSTFDEYAIPTFSSVKSNSVPLPTCSKLSQESNFEEDVVDFISKPSQYPTLVEDYLKECIAQENSKDVESSEHLTVPKSVCATNNQVVILPNTGEETTANTSKDSTPDSFLDNKNACDNSSVDDSNISQECALNETCDETDEQSESDSSLSPPGSPSDVDNLQQKICIICGTEAADVAFVHGAAAHLCACESCAGRIYDDKGLCPICRAKSSSYYKVQL